MKPKYELNQGKHDYNKADIDVKICIANELARIADALEKK